MAGKRRLESVRRARSDQQAEVEQEKRRGRRICISGAWDFVSRAGHRCGLDDGLAYISEAGIDQAAGMLLWFGLHVRQLQIAGVFAGTLMAWLLALTLCIAATLFRRLAGK